VQATRFYEFGPYRIDVNRRVLLRGSARVSLTVKAFDTLLALVERQGQLVEKADLIEQLWPDTAVQESNLTQQIFTLRRVLGESPDDHQFIATIPRRGYRFVAPVTRIESDDATRPQRPLTHPAAPLGSGGGLEGERKQITVLSCRFPQAGAMAERLGHEEMRARLARIIETAAERVRHFEGVVNQVMADGFVALFGAPIVHEDDARRAVLAALGIRSSLLSDGGAPDDEPADRVIQMGVNTGQLIVGRVADDTTMGYTAIGEATDLASLLQQYAGPGVILISDTTRRLVDAEVNLAPIELTVPGRSVGLTAWQVVELAPNRMQLDHRLSRKLAPFVGRRRDLAVLHDALADAANGHGQVVNVVGEPGIGKSRLVYEFRHDVVAAGPRFLEGRCLSYASAIPWVPVVDIVRQACDITEADSAATIRHKATSSLARLEVPDVPGAASAYLLHLLGVGDESNSLRELSPEAVKVRTFSVLGSLILSTSRRQPIALLLEDLHWIDKPSEEFVATLVDRLAGARVVLVATYRPGYRAPWMDRSYTKQITLRPLDADDSLAILSSAMNTKDLPASFSSAVLNRAEGNPFFLEELARATTDHDAMRRLIPDTIQGVIMARLDRLHEPAKRLLQTAAVVGREVPRRLLVRLWEGAGRFEDDLLELRRLEFLYERGDTGDPTYVFKHALTQDVAYDSLLRARRQTLHVRAAEALESLYADRIDEVEGALAYHYARTNLSAKAVTYLVRVADKAALIYANNEAIAHLEQAFQHLQRCPDSVERDRRILDVALRHAHSLYFLGRFRESVDLLLQHESRLARVDDATLSARYFSWLGHMYGRLGDPQAATHSAERAIAQARRAGDNVALGRAHGVLALEGFWSGCPAKGIEHGQQAVALLEQAHDYWWLGMAHCYVAFSYVGTGQFDAAFAAAGRTRDAGLRIGDARLQTYADFTTGWGLANRGQGQAGIDICRRSLELAPDPVSRVYASLFLGYAYLEHGEIARALAELEPVIVRLECFGIPYWRGWAAAAIAEAHRLAGNVDRAADYARLALEITTSVQYRLGIGLAHRALGRAAYSDGRLDDADGSLVQALKTFDAMGAQFESARTRLDLAGLARDRRDSADALSHVRHARHAFVSLGVTSYVDTTDALRARGHSSTTLKNDS
jgi:DNA-binding winged helix-turn-helix (wHTH) protein/tetratricopeptide (TPR) repeat protein